MSFSILLSWASSVSIVGWPGMLPGSTHWKNFPSLLFQGQSWTLQLPSVFSMHWHKLTNPWIKHSPFLSTGHKGNSPTATTVSWRRGQCKSDGWHKVWATCSHNLLVPSGPTCAWSSMYSFHLMMDFCWAIWPYDLVGLTESNSGWAFLAMWSLDIQGHMVHLPRPNSVPEVVFFFSNWNHLCKIYSEKHLT